MKIDLGSKNMNGPCCVESQDKDEGKKISYPTAFISMDDDSLAGLKVGQSVEMMGKVKSVEVQKNDDGKTTCSIRVEINDLDDDSSGEDDDEKPDNASDALQKFIKNRSKK